MPSKIRPDDWDRLFAPNAPRRGGPLRALLNIVVAVLLVALIGAGVAFALDLRQQRYAQALATATAFAPTEVAAQAATAQARLNTTTTIVAALTGTAEARLPTATPEGILTAKVANGGNVRAQPVNGQPLDQISAGETVQLIERNRGGTWFKVTYGRNGQTITGWVSKTLLAIDPTIEQQVPFGQ